MICPFCFSSSKLWSGFIRRAWCFKGYKLQKTSTFRKTKPFNRPLVRPEWALVSTNFRVQKRTRRVLFSFLWGNFLLGRNLVNTNTHVWRRGYAWTACEKNPVTNRTNPRYSSKVIGYTEALRPDLPEQIRCILEATLLLSKFLI